MTKDDYYSENGIIDEKGVFSIERNGRLIEQVCPHNNRDEAQITCGDWCPMFNVKRIKKIDIRRSEGKVQTCGSNWIFGSIEDRRFNNDHKNTNGWKST